MIALLLVVGLTGCRDARYAEPRRSCDEHSCEHQAACEDCVEACPGRCRYYDEPEDTGVGKYECRNQDTRPFLPGQYAEDCTSME